MEPGKVIGMLCKGCKQIIKMNDKNHICSFAQRPVLKYIKPKAQQTPISRNIFESFAEDFLSDAEEEESAAKIVKKSVETQIREPEPDDDDDSEAMSKLINVIRERHPLWDHRLPLSARFEPIKKSLWNEIYVEFNGVYSIEILKKKWRYLREKYTREKKKPKSGSGGERIRSWVHMQSLQFLDDVTTKNKKTSSNFSLAADSDTPDIEPIPYKRKKDDNISFQEAILKEMQASRPILPQVYEQPQEVNDPQDINFANYVVSLMRNIPKKQKTVLQSEIISKIVEYTDD